jgi:hypothetical protein
MDFEGMPDTPKTHAMMRAEVRRRRILEEALASIDEVMEKYHPLDRDYEKLYGWAGLPMARMPKYPGLLNHTVNMASISGDLSEETGYAEIGYEMCKDDFEAAMLFYPECDKNIIIQVPTTSCIPIMRRMVIAYVGEPSMTSASVIGFGDRHIRIISMSDTDYQVSRLPLKDLFYVGWLDGSDLDDYERVSIMDYDSFRLFR